MQLAEFQYDLPDHRIARYPLPERDTSRLLIYRDGKVSHHRFYQLAEQIPTGSMLVFNDTRVIPARAIMAKPTGARIELLLLHPERPTRIISEAMSVPSPVVWECMVGNKKRWKEEDVISAGLRIRDTDVMLEATWENREANLVRLSWNGDGTFLDIVTALGQIPLPPYLGREAENADRETYQTVYAQKEGAVAAPTAGLHFTDRVFEQLAAKQIRTDFVTLHVGAGTFQPIKTDNVREHHMHAEQLVFTRSLIEGLLNHRDSLIAVGTTSLRSLESLYWFGVKCLHGETEFFIEQYYPQTVSAPPSKSEALKAVLDYMEARKLEKLLGETAIFITPGYAFRLIDGLVTNFHQPGSTLILLIAAFVGEDWRKIYREALENEYRFLSYGDSSLLWRKQR